MSTPKSQCSEYVTSTNQGKLTNSEPERASRSEVHRGSRGITEQLEELQSGNGETKAGGLSSFPQDPQNQGLLRLLRTEVTMQLPFSHLLSRLLLALALLILAPAPALATVEITFYSHEFGSNFPHAFITLEGKDDRTGAKISANYGFTATHVTPAILLGSVKGEVFSRSPEKDAAYLASSDRHFSFTLSDAELDKVMATVEKWRTLPQPSYNLNRQNCVFFIADVAASLGMAADTPNALMKKPRSYSEHLTRANNGWLLARGATIHRELKK